jgi:thiamine pyrophosphate-dependent acetolactate synthase large subunit-like protein
VRKLTGGAALVWALSDHGVDIVFGIPGTHNLEIYAHLDAAGIRHVSPRHEQGAGYAADGYARASGQVGVALVTSGPATLNAAAAMGQAYSDSVPVLLISPGMPLRHPGRGNGLLHETKDQRAAMDAVAAYSHRVTSVAEIPVAVAQAFATMTAGRPRPVHLEIPLDVLSEVDELPPVWPLAFPELVPGPVELDAAALALLGAARPVVLAGGGARGAVRELRELAERLGAPVVTTTNGKGVLPDDHPLALGAGVHLPSVRALVQDADTVLVVGSELSPADLWYGPLPLDGRLVRIDIDPVQIVTNANPDVALVGGASSCLRGLLDRLGPGMPVPAGARAGVAAPADPVERAARWRDALRADSRAEGAAYLGIVEALAGALGRDGILAGDSTMACYYGALANLPAYAPATFLYPTGYGTLGYGLPAAIGAKLARPDVPVVALLGDGGVMFTIAELAGAAQLRLPLPVVVVDNSGYGEIRAEMEERGDHVHAVDLDSPDFVGLGRALGCHAVRVGSDSLAAALSDALAADRPTLIHVPLPKEPRP